MRAFLFCKQSIQYYPQTVEQVILCIAFEATAYSHGNSTYKQMKDHYQNPCGDAFLYFSGRLHHSSHECCEETAKTHLSKAL